MRIGLLGLGRIGAFHAETLAGLPAVEELVLSDPVPELAEQAAGRFGARIAGSPEAVLASGVDGVVIAAPTRLHAELIELCVAAGLPTFCEKPLAHDSHEAVRLARRVADTHVQVQIGYPRRFDPAFAAARAAVADGDLGTVHTVRSTTLDPAPPPRAYLAASGGIFRDCAVHDYNAVRWVTGQEVIEVYAVGTNQDAEWFGELDDVHTASAVLTLDGGALAVVSNTRYNARGHDVRLEVHGTRDSLAAGLGPGLPLRSAEPGVSFPDGKPFTFFMDRLAEAFRTELTAFTEVVAGARLRAQFWMRSRPAGWPRPARCRCASTARSRSRKSGSHNPGYAGAVPKTASGGRLRTDVRPPSYWRNELRIDPALIRYGCPRLVLGEEDQGIVSPLLWTSIDVARVDRIWLP